MTVAVGFVVALGLSRCYCESKYACEHSKDLLGARRLKELLRPSASPMDFGLVRHSQAEAIGARLEVRSLRSPADETGRIVLFTWVSFSCKLLGKVGQFSVQINSVDPSTGLGCAKDRKLWASQMQTT